MYRVHNILGKLSRTDLSCKLQWLWLNIQALVYLHERKCKVPRHWFPHRETHSCQWYPCQNILLVAIPFDGSSTGKQTAKGMNLTIQTKNWGEKLLNQRTIHIYNSTMYIRVSWYQRSYGSICKSWLCSSLCSVCINIVLTASSKSLLWTRTGRE